MKKKKKRGRQIAVGNETRMKEKKYVVPSDDNYVQSIKAKSHPSVGAERGKGRKEDERHRS